MRGEEIMAFKFLLSLLVALLVASPGRSGGPLCYNAQKPLVWNSSQPIEYWIDKGPLRSPRPPSDPGVTASKAKQMVQDSFDVWTAIGTCALEFKMAGVLDDDVNTGQEFINATENNTTKNIVIFDQDGAILNDLYGAEQSQSVLGFAAPLVNDQETAITRFVSLMNGELVDSSAPQGFLSTLVHEFGHAVGLDHAQIRPELSGDEDSSNDHLVPIMYPTSTDADDEGLTRPLHPDDVAWASYLYPESNFLQHYGLIRGKLVNKGNPSKQFPGANVVAKTANNTDGPQFSCVSDYLKAGTGEFLIPVPPGTYQLSVVRIRPGFFEGSSVGPYADTKTDTSFTKRPRASNHPAQITVTAGNSQNVTVEAELLP
jgi:hypothetical protein